MEPISTVNTFSQILEKHGPLGLVLIIAIAGNIWLVRFIMKQAENSEARYLMQSENSEARLNTMQEAHLKALAEIVVSVREGSQTSSARDKEILKEIGELRTNVKEGNCKYLPTRS